jgi:hypothetical protein
MASEGHRFAPITPNDHAGSIWIATLVCLVYTFIVFITRAFLRRKMYGIDDYLVLGATVCHSLSNRSGNSDVGRYYTLLRQRL